MSGNINVKMLQANVCHRFSHIFIYKTLCTKSVFDIPILLIHICTSNENTARITEEGR